MGYWETHMTITSSLLFLADVPGTVDPGAEGHFETDQHTSVPADTSPPTLSLSGTTIDALQGGPAIDVLADAPVITDPHGTGTLSSAQVRIANEKPGDILGINGATSGTFDNAITFSEAFGTLQLSGSASIADYEAALADVTYRDAGADASSGAHPTRTLNWSISEGTLKSTGATDVTVSRALKLTAGSNVDYPDRHAPVVIDSTLRLSDLDATPITSATIAIAAGQLSGDLLHFTNQSGITGTFAAGTLVLSGTASASAYQSALRSVSYSSTSSNPSASNTDPSRTISFQAVDASGASNVGDATVYTGDLPCFCNGTRLLGLDGEIDIEKIRPGDWLVTVCANGPSRRQVRWTGYRRINVTRHDNPAAIRPVRIEAGAFGPGQPARDLRLSPHHALYIDGCLFEAISLVNGDTIRQETSGGFVSYHHVELDRHDVILAEGLPCESYLDTGTRDDFEGAPALRLHPVFQTSMEAARCAPLVVEGPRLEAVRARLDRQKAGLLFVSKK